MWAVQEEKHSFTRKWGWEPILPEGSEKTEWWVTECHANSLKQHNCALHRQWRGKYHKTEEWHKTCSTWKRLTVSTSRIKSVKIHKYKYDNIKHGQCKQQCNPSSDEYDQNICMQKVWANSKTKQPVCRFIYY